MFDILQKFITELVNRVFPESQAKRRSQENLGSGGNASSDFEHKFKQYEEEIDRLKAMLLKANNTLSATEEKLTSTARELHIEQEMTQKLMRNINDLTENNNILIQRERQQFESAAACEAAKKDDLISDLRFEIDELKLQIAETLASKSKDAALINELETKLRDFHANWIRKDEHERVLVEKMGKENQVYDIENRLAIEMSKISTYEAQIERLKSSVKASHENESRMMLTIDELNSKIVILNNEIKMLNNRKGSLQLPEDSRVSGNLDIEESGYNSIYFSRAEDDVSRRIEEMERTNAEAQAQLKAKIKELILSNEALNNEVLRLKDQANSLKNDSQVLKRSSVYFSQREVSKVRRHEVSEEVLEKMLSFEVQNKRLKEENLALNKRLTEALKTSINNAEIVFWAAVGYLSE